MTIEEIGRLVALAGASGLSSLSVTLDGCTLTFKARTGPAPTRPATPIPQPAPAITAPAAGILLAAHPDRVAPPPQGRAVAAGEVVALLRVGPCLRPVLAPGAGRLGPALLPDGTLAGFGTPLFAFVPDAAQ